jgi:hypothetical protein
MESRGQELIALTVKFTAKASKKIKENTMANAIKHEVEGEDSSNGHLKRAQRAAFCILHSTSSESGNCNPKF